MVRQLLLMRHGKSRWDQDVADEDRGLTKRGKRDARAVGRWLEEEGLVPDVVLTSPAKRARATARRVAEECEYEGRVVVLPDLYGGDVDACLSSFASLPDAVSTALAVGHNPLLEDLVLFLSARSVTLGTAAMACISYGIATWSGVTSREGRLCFVRAPRELL